MATGPEHSPPSHRRLVTGLLAAVVSMFCFGFLLVPLYDVFCKLTGINGKVQQSDRETPQISADRLVKVQLIALRSAGLRPKFAPETRLFEIHPGQLQETAFIAHNPTAGERVIRAVPSIAPAEAAEYLHKINCFCFEQQLLMAGEQRRMPLVFSIDAGLPEHLKTLTLSYTLFDITDEGKPVAEGVKL